MATAYVSQAALKHNLSVIRSHLKSDTRVLAAVKANGYGHGAVLVADYLTSQQVSWFGVATAEEALELRESGITGSILIFSPVYDRLSELLQADICLTVVDATSWQIIAAAQRQLSRDAPARVHLKVDTGMGRLGLLPEQAHTLAAALDGAGALEGVWTHFASSDDADDTFTRQQLRTFQAFVDELKSKDITPTLLHTSNSAAIFSQPEAHFDLVRPGIALYGYHSSAYIEGLEPTLRPAMQLTGNITFIKRVSTGTPVSYSSMWHAPRDTTVATVRFGYADGYPRLLTGKAEVIVHGVKRPVAGRICMDQLMVDVGELPVQIGDEVTLFGPDLSAETVAQQIGTISYELLTSVSGRVKRVITEA
jgi:alanine racemase